jgi:hypothetical protein
MQKLRLEFWEKIRDIRLEDLVFIDEAGVNLTMVRLYARALKGRRAYGSRPHKREKNVSMIGAIALTRVVAFFEVWGAVDGITFEAFIVRKLIPKLWRGACVVLDNCSIHKGKRLEKALQKAGVKLPKFAALFPRFFPN